MREIVGDLWTVEADAIVVPVCWVLKANGDAVMGAGVALEAAKRRPDLPGRLGQAIQEYPDEPHVLVLAAWPGKRVVLLPTKRHWRQRSDLDLIQQMAAEDLPMCALQSGLKQVAMPRVGCGFGGLFWKSQVRPVLASILDDRFCVVHREDGR